MQTSISFDGPTFVLEETVVLLTKHMSLSSRIHNTALNIVGFREQCGPSEQVPGLFALEVPFNVGLLTGKRGIATVDKMSVYGK